MQPPLHVRANPDTERRARANPGAEVKPVPSPGCVSDTEPMLQAKPQ